MANTNCLAAHKKWECCKSRCIGAGRMRGLCSIIVKTNVRFLVSGQMQIYIPQKAYEIAVQKEGKASQSIRRSNDRSFIEIIGPVRPLAPGYTLAFGFWFLFFFSLGKHLGYCISRTTAGRGPRIGNWEFGLPETEKGNWPLPLKEA